MKAPVVLILAAALLGACSHTRETTIIEKPVSSREVIIERPVASREVIVERPAVVERRIVIEQPVVSYRTCPDGAVAYSDGSVTCRRPSYQYWCPRDRHSHIC